jgi:4a-hydroxytetrahydrobiopterin dehydratase
MVAEILGPGEIAQRLSELDGWHGDVAGIVRSVEMPTFMTGIAAIDQVAQVAEELDHHPDIDIRWRTVTFTCSTHSAGGVTSRDFALAKRIDEIIKGLTGGN